MKQGATLINFARGEIVNNQAVTQAISEGKLARYIVDFPATSFWATKTSLHSPPWRLTPESEEKLRTNGGASAPRFSGTWQYCEFR
jgi:D-3-phosphoglycerate dehydrogenase